MRREYSRIRERLLREGVKIIQGTRSFAPPSRFLRWDYPTPEAIIDRTLEIFGSGTKVAVEAVVIATDAGEVEEVVSCGGTYKGLDTALVVRAAHSANFFREIHREGDNREAPVQGGEVSGVRI